MLVKIALMLLDIFDNVCYNEVPMYPRHRKKAKMMGYKFLKARSDSKEFVRCFLYAALVMICTGSAAVLTQAALVSHVSSDSYFYLYLGMLLAAISTIFLSACDDADTPQRADTLICGGAIGVILHLLFTVLGMGINDGRLAPALVLAAICIALVGLRTRYDSFAPKILGEGAVAPTSEEIEAQSAENHVVATTIANLVGVATILTATTTGLIAAITLGEHLLALVVAFTGALMLAISVMQLRKRLHDHENRYRTYPFRRDHSRAE